MSKLKGEVPFDVDGTSYILVYSADAMVELEEHFGMTVKQIGAMFQKEMKAKDLRALWQIGLSEYHEGLDPKARSHLLSAVGIVDGGVLIGQSFTLAFTGGQVAKAGAARPPKGAASGTGPSSSPDGASSDTTQTASGD